MADRRRFPHVGRLTTVFYDKKERLVMYIQAYSLDEAKGLIRDFDEIGIKAKAIVRYRGMNRIVGGVNKPVYLVHFGASRVLIELHKSWWTEPKLIWKRKKK